MMLDCGADWLGQLDAIHPSAILLTHAHPDHAFGLRNGAPCPVYASADCWRSICSFPIRGREQLPLRKRCQIHGIYVSAWPVVHSLRAPAIGLRIETNGSCLFYVPDVAAISDADMVLRNVQLYIGDGASLSRPILRRRSGALIGHASIAMQLKWCAEHGIPHAIFTHCGTQIVRGDGRSLRAALNRRAHKYLLTAGFARDGMELRFCRAKTASPDSDSEIHLP
jgi:phosphoribosyl 1,2-cyclic phosphodiesterase